MSSGVSNVPDPAVPPRYEEWLDFIFGRLNRDCDDPFRMDWAFEASAGEVADLFIYTMENSGRDLARFTDAQVAGGLNAMLFANYGSVAHVLTGGGPTEAQRVAVLQSLTSLYRDCLAKRSPPVHGHRSESQGNPLEFVTYMLWDVTPYDLMAMKSEERMTALFNVLSSALRLENEACAESALHGLGHLGGDARKRAQATIDDWLSERPKVRPELLDYARAARTGCIQ